MIIFFIRFFILTTVLFFLIAACESALTRENDTFEAEGLPFLSFDPQRTENAILRLISDARQSIEISLYGFENEAIADALIEAHQMRGVRVRMSSEFDSEASPSFQRVVSHGIPVRFGNASGIMHNKYILVDRKYMLTGSTNLTSGLFRHFNNVIILKNPELIEEYLRDFEVQFTGYYAAKKDEGYDKLHGGLSLDEDNSFNWDFQTHRLANGSSITAYFTPYKDSFPEYTHNTDPPLPPCTDSAKTCLNRPSGSRAAGSPCEDQTCTDIACYADLSRRRGRNKIVHAYYNYDDKNENGEPKLYCAAYDNAMNRVVPLLRNAQKSILVLAFAFRDRLFQHELIQARQERMVDVRVWIDHNQYRSGYKLSRGSFRAVAQKAGFLKICRKPDGGLLHHKIVVIDNETVVLGSMNFSQNAVNSNDENFVIIENAPALAKAFYQEAARIDKYSYHLSDLEADRGSDDEREDDNGGAEPVL